MTSIKKAENRNPRTGRSSGHEHLQSKDGGRGGGTGAPRTHRTNVGRLSGQEGSKEV